MSGDGKLVEDFDLPLISDFYNLLERQGPGSEDVTRKALGFVGALSDDSRIADIGCGNGGQTMTLAASARGHITAIDFLPDFIATLEGRIGRAGFRDRISTLVESMDKLPFRESELDLIWSEGAIYNIGFANGLRQWRDCLKPGGHIAVSEVTWLTSERPAEIEDFWMRNYPEIDSIAHKVAQVQQAGYVPVAHFVLPEDCWLENFYDPMPAAMATFLEQHGHSEMARAFVESQKTEMDLYRKYRDYYSYVFYVGRKR